MISMYLKLEWGERRGREGKDVILQPTSSSRANRLPPACCCCCCQDIGCLMLECVGGPTKRGGIAVQPCRGPRSGRGGGQSGKGKSQKKVAGFWGRKTVASGFTGDKTGEYVKGRDGTVGGGGCARLAFYGRVSRNVHRPGDGEDMQP